MVLPKQHSFFFHESYASKKKKHLGNKPFPFEIKGISTENDFENGKMQLIVKHMHTQSSKISLGRSLLFALEPMSVVLFLRSPLGFCHFVHVFLDGG